MNAREHLNKTIAEYVILDIENKEKTKVDINLIQLLSSLKRKNYSFRIIYIYIYIIASFIYIEYMVITLFFFYY